MGALGLLRHAQRFRFALPLLLVLLLAAALHGALLSWRLAAAALALGAAYLAATSLNDVADVELDRVNLAGHSGRPLVTGEATRAQLLALHLAASVAALALGFAAGSWPGLAIVAGVVALDAAYSLRPLRLSYRAHLAPPSLALGYAVAPFALGLAAARAAPSRSDLLVASGLWLLLVGRLLLKDLRDAEGDARGGKTTFLLRHGKGATIRASAALLLAGAALVLAAFPLAAWWLALPAAALAAGALVALRGVARAQGREAEQRAIAMGVRQGNAFLIALLTLALAAPQSPGAQLVAVALVAGLALGNLVALLARPERVAVGYRG